MTGILGPSRRVGAKNLVGFEVGKVSYAVDIQRVKEIIRPLTMIVLPRMPEAVLGVSDHRGDVVPVVDMRARLGLAQRDGSKQGRWIVVGREDRLVALVVDRVTEVFGGEAAKERDVPQLGTGDEARGISTVYAHRGGLVFVVDVDRLTDVSEHLDMSLAGELLREGTADDAS